MVNLKHQRAAKQFVVSTQIQSSNATFTHKKANRNKNIANTTFIDIRPLFDLLLSENLDNMLIKLCELILPSIHLLGMQGALI